MAIHLGENRASIQEFIESSIRNSDPTLSIVSNRSLLSAWVALESVTAFYSEKPRGPFACAISVIIGELTMAAVLSFYQLPDEEETFLDYVESTGKIIAVPFEIARTRSDFTPLPLRECLNRFNPDKVAFGLEEHSELIKIGAYFDKKGEYFTVSLMASPLISYTRSRWRAPQQLGMSNLAAYWSYPNESATAMLDHPGEFIKWAKKIFRKGRDIATRWPEHESLRMTPLVAAAIREGVKLVS